MVSSWMLGGFSQSVAQHSLHCPGCVCKQGKAPVVTPPLGSAKPFSFQQQFALLSRKLRKWEHGIYSFLMHEVLPAYLLPVSKDIIRGKDLTWRVWRKVRRKFWPLLHACDPCPWYRLSWALLLAIASSSSLGTQPMPRCSLQSRLRGWEGSPSALVQPLKWFPILLSKLPEGRVR